MIFLNELKIALIIIVCFFSSCRYEDGPAISLRSPENRLIGEYAIFKFEKGGIDLTDSLKKVMCYNMFIIHKNGEFEAIEPNGTCGCRGYWAFYDNKKKINLDIRWPDTLIAPLGEPFDHIIWDIERLTDDEVHLTINYNNQFIKFNLKE